MANDLFSPVPDTVIVRGPGFWGLLGEADRRDLLSAGRPRVFAPDTVLCLEGEPTTHVFVLLAGWVKVSADSYEGRGVLQALRGGGDVVGEIAGQVTGYRTATVRAAGTVRALLVASEQFWSLLDTHSAVAQAFRQATAEWQQAAYAQQRSLTLYNGPQRLAGLLLDLADQQRRVGGGPPPLSQEDLASLIGASRSTVTRALHAWRSRQIIGTDQRRTEILDRARLLRLAGRAPAEL
jgi:CRP/FNR family cyclic AMP-dependent transcriptional regulator